MLTRNLLLFFTAVLVFFVGVTRPFYNWDIIGYVASAYYADGYRGAELSNRTYGAIRGEVSKATFTFITHDGKYEDAVFSNPVALEEHVPLYSIRVVYVELMRALKLVGVGYPMATYLISALFAGLSVYALGAVLSATGIPMLVLPLVVIGSGFANISRLSTPDALACFFCLLAMYCLVTNRKLVFVISAVLPLMRTDSVLLSGLLMAYTFFQGQRVLSSVSLVLSLVGYLLVNSLHANYGWLTLFNFTFLSTSAFPAEIPLSHHLVDYLLPYGRTFRDLLIEPGAQILIYLLCIFTLIRHRAAAGRFASYHALLTIPLCLVVLRLMVYPNYEDRYYVFPAAMILAGTLGILANVLHIWDDSAEKHASSSPSSRKQVPGPDAEALDGRGLTPVDHAAGRYEWGLLGLKPRETTTPLPVQNQGAAGHQVGGGK